MDLAVGTRLGHFEIVGNLGAGAMGQVYRARDTLLGREVAVKVVPEDLGGDPEIFQRFQREARIAASLTHPNVAAVHELLQDNGTAFFAMELVEGQTLAQYINQRRPSVREIIDIFIQIAEGLEAAHSKGIVHRDLKPTNIKITHDGRAKILDFGIAKLTDAHGLQSLRTAASEATTISVRTTEGTIVGTPSYMSPEQARGEPIDRRTDVWAFGCCLYQALTRKIAFTGDTTLDILTQILERTPDYSKIPADVPEPVVRLIKRCLMRDKRRRLRDLGDAALELQDALEAPTPERAHGGNAVWKWIAALSTLALIAVLALVSARPAPPAATVSQPQPRGMTAVHRSVIKLDPAMPLHSSPVPAQRLVDISPDGTRIVYAGDVAGTRQLILRRLDRNDSRPLIGTEDAYQPAFSPDGNWIAFISNEKLRKVSIQGGNLTTICPARFAFGLSWADNNTIVFSSDFQKGIKRVSAAGGEPEEITLLGARDSIHGMPKMLPGRNALLFSGGEVPELNQLRVMVQDLDSGNVSDIAFAASGPWYLPTGHILYSQYDRVTAVPFNIATLSTQGDAVDVTEPDMAVADMFQAQLAYSSEGTLIYAPAYDPGYAQRTLHWVDREGNETDLPLPPRRYITPRISPDGTHLAVTLVDDNWEIWVYNLATGEGHPITNDAGNDYAPAWSPDGQKLIFASRRMGNFNVFETSMTGVGGANRLYPNDFRQTPGAYMPDGEHVLFNLSKPHEDASEIGMLALGPESTYTTITSSPNIGHPLPSPNGEWVAFVDRASQDARIEVFIARIDSPTERHQVSVGGGTEPVWAPDGSELFFRSENTLHAATIHYEPELQIDPPEPLFADVYHNDGSSRMYDVSPDGQKFLMLRLLPRETIRVTELYMVENWFEDIRRRVPRSTN